MKAIHRAQQAAAEVFQPACTPHLRFLATLPSEYADAFTLNAARFSPLTAP
jgi:hypothetical protein